MAVGQSSYPESTYLELVSSLFVVVWPAVTMTLCFVGIGGLIVRQTPDIGLEALLLLGGVAGVARIVVVLAFRSQATQESLLVVVAHKLERRFASAYLSFAAIFGGFCAYAIAIEPVAANAGIVALIYGYGAGVAAGLSLRPRISVAGMIVATVPTIFVMALKPDILHRALGLMTAVFVIGGVHSMLTRYRTTATDITMRRSFSTQARRDHLTGLPNRLALEEHFAAVAAAGGLGRVAVHCLDLDRFKPVNDRFGHQAGDAVLQAVAARLLGVVRGCDFVARVGGDEFVVVQTQVHDHGEASALAMRITSAIAEPFVIDGNEISIATSVGFVLSPSGEFEFGGLLVGADQALGVIKRRSGGIQRYG